MSAELLAGIGAGIALVFLLLGFLVGHVRAMLRTQRVEKLLAASEQKSSLQTEQLQQQKDSIALQQEKYQSLLSRFNQTATRLSEREASFSQQLQQFEEHKHLLKQEFENLANKVFEDKQRTFNAQSEQSLSRLLKPFREQIDGFQRRINDVHGQSIKGQAALEAEINKVLDVGLKMRDEASNLASALKGDAQKRGAWGEAQLQRTLELSGLVDGAHFTKQQSFRDKDGKLKQTDYLVTLPDAKQIIIDSKITLNAYEQFSSADDEVAQMQALEAHAAAVKAHVDDLASKDYTNLIGIHSPGFVLMFMPIEPAFIAALQYKKQDLFSYAYQKNIILVSHTTLIPILKTVANLWMLESSNAEAREISERAGDIYNQLCVVAERLSKLGNSLSAVGNHYNATVKALAGQQGLHGKVERFSQISSKVSKTMKPIPPLHADIDNDKLSLMIEALDDSGQDSDLITETAASIVLDEQVSTTEESR